MYSPLTDDRTPSSVVSGMVDDVLALAETWPTWDGSPRVSGDRVYTPHKAIRRVVDHLVDHLAELEATLAGAEPLPDHWHGSSATTRADLAEFTAEDLAEARSRLTRLAQIWRLRLDSLTDEELDKSTGGWSPRELAFHVAESAYYAEVVGNLTPRTPA
ncbi:MAG: hypothetical protein HOU81_21330 [Hamadaea sp.]|uniref:hypothetical protein n=1 Tax=Hamadaea sp. TaxID=2024425 RepID=UPI0017BC1328|nr:hypothetical protein [Hamadaea sp.]NUR73369.1 hypothetical protein [Hamadaea sp.]NUT21263.1 hypothetical protein [Hamadaea sp.]